MMTRNSKGQLVYAKTGRFWNIFTSQMAETMAIKEALSWSQTRGRGRAKLVQEKRERQGGNQIVYE